MLKKKFLYKKIYLILDMVSNIYTCDVNLVHKYINFGV